MLHDTDLELGVDQSGESLFGELDLRDVVVDGLGSGGLLRDGLLRIISRHTQTAKILTQEHEIVLILDPAIPVEVHLVK